MNMLDPTAIANTDCSGPEDIRGLFIRRFTKDVRAQLKKVMHEREVHELRTCTSEEEEAVLRDKQKGGSFVSRSIFPCSLSRKRSKARSLKRQRRISFKTSNS